MNKQIILHKLIKPENHQSKDQNKKLEKANEDIEKLLSAKNEEISRLKNHNQDLKDIIKKSSKITKNHCIEVTTIQKKT